MLQAPIGCSHRASAFLRTAFFLVRSLDGRRIFQSSRQRLQRCTRNSLILFGGALNAVRGFITAPCAHSSPMFDERHFPNEHKCAGCSVTVTVTHEDVQDVPSSPSMSVLEAVEYVMRERRGWSIEPSWGGFCPNCIDVNSEGHRGRGDHSIPSIGVTVSIWAN